jgi:hypothetical protein
MRSGLLSFAHIVKNSTRLYVINVHEMPLGDRISACPPSDWRNPEVIRNYNKILAALSEELSIPYLNTTDIISPMWDTAQDWCHYESAVGKAEAIYVARSLSYPYSE